MAERSIAQQRLARAEFDSYLRTTAASSGTGPVDDLARLSDLRGSGVITDAEFETMKARVVGGTPASEPIAADPRGGST
jgi:hypothetical protein